MSGATEVDGVRLDPGSMLCLGSGRTELPLRALGDSGLLLGGEPFGEEIAEGRAAWMAGDRFGTVHGYGGAPLPAPPCPCPRLSLAAVLDDRAQRNVRHAAGGHTLRWVAEG